MSESFTVQLWWLYRGGKHPPTAPPTKGSVDPYVNRRTGKFGVKPNNPQLEAWQHQVALQVMAARPSGWPRDGAYRLDIEYQIRRARERIGQKHVKHKPDLDKLDRAVFDALSGVVYDDDGQVSEQSSKKVYGFAVGPPGAKITITLLDE